MRLFTDRIHSILFAALLSGFAAAVGQTLLLRELLALFGGYEPAAVALLAGWLLWGALGSFVLGRMTAAHEKLAGQLLVWSLLLLGLLAPCMLLLARVAPLALHLLGLPQGVRPSLDVLAMISLLASGPFCFLAGGAFALCWRLAQGVQSPPLGIYFGEALGAALGGVAVFVCLAPLATPLSSLSLALALCLLCWLGGILLLEVSMHLRLLCMFFGLALGGLFFFMLPGLERESLTWRWGPDAVASRDTPQQRVVLLQREGERSYFGGSGWLFTMPDPYHAQWSVQPALLAHPRPQRVLLLGGNPFALLGEVLRQPTVREAVHVEPDAGLLDFLRSTLPEDWQAPALSPKIRLVQQDPLEYALEHARDSRRAGQGVDVILLNAGEPVNAQSGRLYSLEFFRRLRKLLAPGGVLFFALPASPDALGPAQEAQLASLQATAKEVFAHVKVVLGAQALFFCSQMPLSLELETLLKRLQQRGLAMRYVREESLRDLLSPFRQDYAEALLQERQGVVNRMLRPSAYFHSAVLWLHEFKAGGWLREAPQKLQTVKGRLVFWTLAGLLGAAMFLPRKPSRAVPLAVLLGGAGGLALEIGALLAFQGLAGSLYSRLALFVAAWMSGLGLGAWLVGRVWSGRGQALRGMILLQAVLCLLLAACGPVLSLLVEQGVEAPWTGVFTLFCLGGGLLGGGHFGLAAKSQAAAGATLYAMDLAGAACGALIAGLLLTPLLGLSAALGFFACLLAGSCVGLWRGAAKVAS